MPDTKKKRSSPAPNFSVYLPHVERLRKIAYFLGYVAKTGPRAGEGSIQALLEALATEEIGLTIYKGGRRERQGEAGSSK